MPGFYQAIKITPALIAVVLLAACGGGNSSSSSSPVNQIVRTTTPQEAEAPQESGAPQATGNIATDGFNWFNYRRQQLGLPVLRRNAQVDQAAQAHSDYQTLNDNQITHEEIPGKPGYTGKTFCSSDISQDTRLYATGYSFGDNGYACGEVISKSGSNSGVKAAEELITAIYHRFVIFEPMFKEAGAGSATSSGQSYFFTADFISDGFNGGLGHGNYVVYPFANQRSVPVNFFSDQEEPDPVAGKNEVGYPISVHADIDEAVTVTTFSVQPRGGGLLPVKQLTHALDTHTGESAAAIIPLNPLSRATTYDVKFIGTVGGVAASRSWTFTTR